jgi:hypothetical protein
VLEYLPYIISHFRSQVSASSVAFFLPLDV